jgi:5-methylcytosine-specific restriction endonuclease McrA
MMSEDQVSNWITKLIGEDRLHDFYVSPEWRALRKEVLVESKYECQICKSKGLYTKANHVHHVQYVRKHPRYALSKTYTFKGEIRRNLIAVCHNCHEELHGYRQPEKKEKPLTEERW